MSGPDLTVAVVARRMGIAPATLRTWDRRYGVGPSRHEAGTRRRYAPEDVARLERMRALLLSGVSTAEAARMVTTTGQADAAEGAADPADAEDDAAGTGPVAAVPVSPPTPGRAGGGRALAVGSTDLQVRGLSRAAMALDEEGARHVVRRALTERGVVAAWDEVLRPVLQAVGERWAVTGEGVEVEHLLSDVAHAELRRVAGVDGPRPPYAPVLLACVDGDYHALPLQALAAALGERGVSAHTLGGSVPPEALRAAVARVGPGVVVLQAELPVPSPEEVLAAVPTTRPPVTVVVGGAGWDGRPAPRALRVHGLADAVEGVLGGLGLRSA